jgi:hypothetical protein
MTHPKKLLKESGGADVLILLVRYPEKRIGWSSGDGGESWAAGFIF